MASRKEAKQILKHFEEAFGFDWGWKHVESYLEENYEETPCYCSIFEHCAECCDCDEHKIDPSTPF